MSEVQVLLNRHYHAAGERLPAVAQADAKAFHQSLPGYAATPLRDLPALAAHVRVGSVRVKDESARFGLNAFKGLGASYAIARHLAQQFDLPVDFNVLAQNRERFAGVTVVTATDGNHGRSVAWTAQLLGLPAVVLMPKGSDEARANHIRSHGAQCLITDVNYDNTVRRAAQMAQENGWLLVQDTAWPGYEEVPLAIMQGYTTLADEIRAQCGDRLPTHLILQAGVGSFAAALAARVLTWPTPPAILVLEAQAADCFYQSAQAGHPQAVEGALATIMAGLACGEVSSLAWPILRDQSRAFCTVSDHVAANGMRLLAAPRGQDPAIVSGESAAGGIGLLDALRDRDAARADLGLDQDAHVLVISTEGNTSPAMYDNIVWRGLYGM